MLPDGNWTSEADVLAEGWLMVSDHPRSNRTPFHDAREAVATSQRYDLRPDINAVVLRLDDEDFAEIETLRNPDGTITAVRTGINERTFDTTGTWTDEGTITAPSGRLRIGHIHHPGPEYLIDTDPTTTWRIHRFIEDTYGTPVGIALTT